jgi:predicted dinucleotide-binding enzyme
MFGRGAAANQVASRSACVQVRARTAAGFGDVVALAVPFGAIDAAREQAGPLAGKVLSSCVSALKPDHLGLAVGFVSSAAWGCRQACVVVVMPPFAEAPASDALADDHELAPSVFHLRRRLRAKQLVAQLVRSRSMPVR